VLSPSAIAIENLVFRYPGKTAAPVLSIRHWQVEPGQRVFLSGPSGGGKTTLLNLLAGVTTATDGKLEVLGVELAKLSNRQRDRFRASHIGMVFQQFNLIPYLSILDNLLLAARLGGTSSTTAKKRAISLFTALGLDNDILAKRPEHLSTGQQQRAAIARALVNAPAILLADEPTSALDNVLRDNFIQHLLTATEEWNSTLIFVSHDHNLSHCFQQAVSMQAINRPETREC